MQTSRQKNTAKPLGTCACIRRATKALMNARMCTEQQPVTQHTCYQALPVCAHSHIYISKVGQRRARLAVMDTNTTGSGKLGPQQRKRR